MFFKTPKKRFLAQKNVRFISFFFKRSKEANRMIGSNFTRPPFSSACKALWGDDAIWFLALAACAQFRFFFIENNKLRVVTCRSDRDVYSALSAWPWLLFQGRSWRKTRGFRERRSFVISIFDHWKSTDRFFFVCLWKMNSHAKWSWMCVLQRTLFFVKAGGRLVTLHWIFFKTHFLIFDFDGDPGTIKVHDAYIRLAWWFARFW